MGEAGSIEPWRDVLMARRTDARSENCIPKSRSATIHDALDDELTSCHVVWKVVVRVRECLTRSQAEQQRKQIPNRACPNRAPEKSGDATLGQLLIITYYYLGHVKV